MQVKEFSLEDLGHGFDWLKKVLEHSELMGRVRYRENEPKPVDVRTVLALLTLFHPQWEIDDKDSMEINPFQFFDKHGSELVMDIVEQSQELGNNPNAAGKSRMLWSGLKTKVENHILKARQAKTN